MGISVLFSRYSTCATTAASSPSSAPTAQSSTRRFSSATGISMWTAPPPRTFTTSTPRSASFRTRPKSHPSSSWRWLRQSSTRNRWTVPIKTTCHQHRPKKPSRLNRPPHLIYHPTWRPTPSRLFPTASSRPIHPLKATYHRSRSNAGQREQFITAAQVNLHPMYPSSTL